MKKTKNRGIERNIHSLKRVQVMCNFTWEFNITHLEKSLFHKLPTAVSEYKCLIEQDKTEWHFVKYTFIFVGNEIGNISFGGKVKPYPNFLKMKTES